MDIQFDDMIKEMASKIANLEIANAQLKATVLAYERAAAAEQASHETKKEK